MLKFPELPQQLVIDSSSKQDSPNPIRPAIVALTDISFKLFYYKISSLSFYFYIIYLLRKVDNLSYKITHF